MALLRVCAAIGAILDTEKVGGGLKSVVDGGVDLKPVKDGGSLGVDLKPVPYHGLVSVPY